MTSKPAADSRAAAEEPEAGRVAPSADPRPSTGVAARSTPSSSSRAAVGERIASLLAQAASVVFAVLVALAVDQWWEDRENAELGRLAMAAVAAELRGNLNQLERGSEQLTTVLNDLAAAIDTLAVRPDANLSISVNYNVALLSSAAWQTAQVTRALHYVPLERVVLVARVYDLQAFTSRSQDALAERIAGIGAAAQDDEPLGRLRDIRVRYATVRGMRLGLISAYRCVLSELEGRPPEHPEECEGVTT